MASIPDYDVHRQVTSAQNPHHLRPSDQPQHPESSALYPSTSYPSSSRSSLLDPSFEHRASSVQEPLPASNASHPSDPHDFYRQYRDSFRAREPSAIYALGSDDANTDRMTTAVMGLPRVSHFETKANGVPAASVTVRLNSLAKKASQESMGRRDNIHTHSGLRGRQTSLKALVNKFEQSPDEVLPMPGSSSASRSTSTHTSPATAFNQRSFRARTPSANPSEDRARAERRISGADRPPFDGHGLNVRKRNTKRSSGELRMPFSANGRRASTQTISSINDSHAPSDPMHQARLASTSQMPLFGEIIAGQADHGWGIPRERPRRGSEGSIQRPSSIFRDDADLEPTGQSLEAWYGRRGSVDDMHVVRSQPRSVHLQHSRSRSDLSGLHYTFKQSESDEATPARIDVGSITPTRGSRQPRRSVRPGEYSNASESDYPTLRNAPGVSRDSYSSRQAAQSLPPTSGAFSAAVSARKSPRRGAPGDIHATSPRLGAMINDVGAREPAKSPPLRSSRTRQNMATASTAASRGKTVERSATVGAERSSSKAPRILPELGGVDLAARRERIQRAFSKSVEAKEAEQRRSLILEAHRRKQEESEVPPVPAINQQHFANSGVQEGKVVQHAREASVSGPGLKVDTDRASALQPSMRRESTDDSPTLGALNLLPSRNTAPSSASDTDRRSSIASSGTYLEDDSQGSPVVQRELTGELSAHPNAEAVHIVLSDASAAEPTPPADSRWSMSSLASSTDSNNRFSSDRTDVRLESIHEVNDSNDHKLSHMAHPSTSVGRTSVPDHPTWSPHVDLSATTSSSSGTELARDNIRVSGHDHWVVAEPVSRLRHGNESLSLGSSLNPHTASNAASKFSQRASLVDVADFAAASPSIGDWIAHQAEDTPIEEKSKHSFSDRVTQSTTQKPTGLRRPGSRPITPKAASSPQLPEIKSAGGDWGIMEINSSSPRKDLTTKAENHGARTPAPSRNVSGGIQTISQGSADIPAPTNTHRISSSPRRDLISKYNSTTDASDVFAPNDRPTIRPSSTRSDVNGENTEAVTNPSPVLRDQSQVPSQSVLSSTLSQEQQSKRDDEQKRLNRRKNIIKELVDTESSFGQDMTVVVDIYKETSHVILQNPDDVKTLFGNATEIVQFSTQFLDALKLASSTVYKLPRSKRWRSKRDSSATADSSNGDESSINNTDLTEDERDRMTSVGQCFEKHLSDMETIYTEYLKNHESASAKLVQLQKSDKVQIWLTECRSYAHDLTTAWDLDSLLVKPVQRILKYPLLLRELVEVTPENHPDFMLLDNASREIVGLSQRINAAKKRADLVIQATDKGEKPRKKAAEETRNVFSKTFGRNKDKLRNQVNLSDVVQDKAYNILADKFGSHFFQVQVVMRDVEVYTLDVQKWVQQFDDFVGAIEEFMDVAPSSCPEIESKWRIFRNCVREIQTTALADHLTAVKKSVIAPMATLLKLYEGPQILMEKRKKRLLDHARWRASIESGAKVDKKIVEHGEQFVALNETLKEELPKLFSSTKKLVEYCQKNLVQLQLLWLTVWRRKMAIPLGVQEPPRAPQDIIDRFISDFKDGEFQIAKLGICNGSLLVDNGPTFSPLGTGQNSSLTTLNDDDSASRQTSLTIEDERAARMMLNDRASSRNRAASTNSQSVYANANVPYFPAAYAQGPSTRHRTNSTASGRSREQHTWSMTSSHLQVNSPQGSAPPSGRPSSQSQRTNSGPYGQNAYDPGSYMRYSEDSTRSSSHWYSNLPGHGSSSRTSESGFGIGAALAGAAGAAAAPANPRGSAIFSSALPPSDSPPHSASLQSSMYTSTPPNMEPAQQPNRARSQYKVLFLAASVYEFNIDRARREAGYPYLTYAAGEIFDVIGEKGELWLAKNQDDPSNTLGWIWNKHFARLVTD